MSKININKENKIITLKKWQYLTHYYVVLLPIAIAAVISSTNFKISYIIPFLCISFFFFLLQKRKLRLKEFKINCQHDDLVSAFHRSAQSLDWKIESTEGILYAYDKEMWAGKNDPKYLIVIAKTDQGFLFNSLPDPSRLSFPLVRGYFKLNLNVFIKHLTDTLKGIDYNEEFETLKNEWTIKKILTRLFLYPLSIGIIYFLIYSLSSNIVDSPKGAISIIVAAIVSIVYLYFDIKGIIKNR